MLMVEITHKCEIIRKMNSVSIDTLIKICDVEFGSLLISLNCHMPLLELQVQLETLDAHPFMPE
ncbi:hypothetical protein MKX03_025264 [Papaver bracteatum]|nr:hypothetical protein MKX03_025264 [Papaver bracteatum]